MGDKVALTEANVALTEANVALLGDKVRRSRFITNSNLQC